MVILWTDINHSATTAQPLCEIKAQQIRQQFPLLPCSRPLCLHVMLTVQEENPTCSISLCCLVRLRIKGHKGHGRGCLPASVVFYSRFPLLPALLKHLDNQTTDKVSTQWRGLFLLQQDKTNKQPTDKLLMELFTPRVHRLMSFLHIKYILIITTLESGRSRTKKY